MSDSLSSAQHGPPSVLVGGRLLLLLSIQLVAVVLGLGLTYHLRQVNADFLDRYEYLDRTRIRITQISDRLQDLQQQIQQSPANAKQGAIAQDVLIDLMGLSASLTDSPVELSGQVAAVNQTVAELKNGALAVRVGKAGGSAPDLIARIAKAEWSLNTLRQGVDALDSANIAQVRENRLISYWKNGFEIFACVLIVCSFVFAIRLHRRTRHEELARFKMEQEMAAERRDMERRIQTRTMALEDEIGERKRVERLSRGRNRILEMVASNEPVVEILQVLAMTIAEFSSTWACAVHIMNAGSLDLVASSGLNPRILQKIRTISMGFSGAPESVAISCGRAHLIVDLGQEHKTWSELLRAHGLQSAWSAPFIAADGIALGTLTVYTLLKWNPSEADIEMLESARNMAAMVVERSRFQTQLLEHAYQDSLTGLPNRRTGRDRLESATARAERAGSRIAVLWIDLNRFKHINDQYGHPVGDAVLQHVAERLSSRLRASDTVARMGGDEFMALIEGVAGSAEAEALSADLLHLLAQPMKIGGQDLTVTASIGICIYPDDAKTVDSLAKRADKAMYAAKFDHCGVLSFSPEMDKESSQRAQLEDELSRALESNAFSLVYQPICQRDGVLQGFEALLRFHSPKLGSVSPAHFIPIVEEMQLIVPIGEWVLRETCLQIGKWREDGHDSVSVSVNISPVQFARHDFADTVEAILAETGQQGTSLVLELTEGSVMHDFTESSCQMKRLKDLGVRIAIDDFGTGYSSLSYLHRLPIDVLKIDRSFIEKLEEPDGTRPIVEAVLSMARTLGLSVVAEGVETLPQLNLLIESNCDLVQGYYFSRPIGTEVAASFLKSGMVVHAEVSQPLIAVGESC